MDIRATFLTVYISIYYCFHRNKASERAMTIPSKHSHKDFLPLENKFDLTYHCTTSFMMHRFETDELVSPNPSRY